MTTTASWFNTPVNWLDERGKGAWLAAMIIGFVFLWPVGLAILFYMLWSKRMSGSFFCNRSARRHSRRSVRSTGNTAFDAYRDDTLARLEDEQTAFNDFLARLRDAKDKTEFDAFMDERSTQVDDVEKEKEDA
ncbi:MAG: DUF2852 domain-containing protein [Rhodobacteraceae bacterium]|nr:DUF2852 domain-containing protein [Paracoccaceae bacterium]